VRLAGSDGVQAAEAIRTVRNIPIVFCTAHADDPSFRARTAHFERSSVLDKPVQEQQLKVAIDDLVRTGS
jgi:CheY-like chemotaxis protein